MRTSAIYQNYFVIPGVKVMSKSDVLIEIVASAFDITIIEIKSQSTKLSIVKARQITAYVLFFYTSLTLKQIGYRINRNHATIIHSLKVVSDMITTKDKDYHELIQKIENICNLNFIRNDRPAY